MGEPLQMPQAQATLADAARLCQEKLIVLDDKTVDRELLMTEARAGELMQDIDELVAQVNASSSVVKRQLIQGSGRLDRFEDQRIANSITQPEPDHRSVRPRRGDLYF